MGLTHAHSRTPNKMSLERLNLVHPLGSPARPFPLPPTAPHSNGSFGCSWGEGFCKETVAQKIHPWTVSFLKSSHPTFSLVVIQRRPHTDYFQKP